MTHPTHPHPAPASAPPARLAVNAWRLGVSLAAIGALFVVLLLDRGVRSQLGERLSSVTAELGEIAGREFFLNPWFYVVITAVLLLERLVPARAGQALLSRGTRHDLLWVPFRLVMQASFLPAVIVLLRLGYDRWLSFLTVEAVAGWPTPARLALAVLWGDFLFWLIHYVRHKVEFLWYFHAVHHSQKELSFFTEYRVHPLDDLFAMTLGVIPILMVEHSYVNVTAILWLRHWHTRIYHSNIRTDFGPLRYVLVTPQSHRVHHSVEKAHRDRNFGLTFSIWDHLFATQWRNYDDYPETGIDDSGFPFEQDRAQSSVGTLLSQLAYPFRAAARRP